jgi:hypothetical protein
MCVSNCVCLTLRLLHHVLSTGQGGCDLLGGKEQTSDQKLVSANSDMLVNVALGLPVRYFRRNNDADSSTGSSIFYDGLYYVVSVWEAVYCCSTVCMFSGASGVLIWRHRLYCCWKCASSTTGCTTW